jgi:hypothetical protein
VQLFADDRPGYGVFRKRAKAFGLDGQFDFVAGHLAIHDRRIAEGTALGSGEFPIGAGPEFINELGVATFERRSGIAIMRWINSLLSPARKA